MNVDGLKSRTTEGAARSWMLAVVLVGLLGAVRELQAQAQALTLAEVLALRTQGVSPRQILRSARQYCIAFTINDSIQKQLDAAGADSVLVGGLRTSCSNRDLPASTGLPSDVLLDDNFSRSGGRGGFGATDGRCNVHVDGAALRLENHARDVVCVTGYPSGPLDDNVRIELTVNRLGANRLGLVVLGFGRDPDLAGQYSFSVTADRRVVLCRSEGGTCQRLVYKTGVTAVHTGTADENRLAVEIRGRRITLLVNDQAIDTYTADGSVMGTLSLGVGPGTNVDVTRIIARRLAVAPTGR
jgi:hypothetical protein